MTHILRLQLTMDDREPQNLATRELGDDEEFGVYNLALWVLSVIGRLITWQAWRNKTRDDFETVLEQAGET